MSLPKRAGDAPIAVEFEIGKVYAWCSCGESSNQPYCDGSHSGTDFKPVIEKASANETKYLCTCKQTANGPFCDGSHVK